jgi:hypothetical protein
MRVPSLLAVVDLDQKKLIWAMQGSFKYQHDPKILANGNLLFFDNQGLPRQSRVIEFDPADRSARWEYTGSASDPFFSEACGTAERLPNGNTLITESDNGRAFELTPDKTLVWEFFNPIGPATRASSSRRSSSSSDCRRTSQSAGPRAPARRAPPPRHTPSSSLRRAC